MSIDELIARAKRNLGGLPWGDVVLLANELENTRNALGKTRAEIERLTRERDERESTLASLCDCVNTFAREEGTGEASDYSSLSEVRDALSCVVFSLRRKNEQLTQERAAARDAEAAASNTAAKFGIERDEALDAARWCCDELGTCADYERPGLREHAQRQWRLLKTGGE